MLGVAGIEETCKNLASVMYEALRKICLVTWDVLRYVLFCWRYCLISAPVPVTKHEGTHAVVNFPTATTFTVVPLRRLS